MLKRMFLITVFFLTLYSNLYGQVMGVRAITRTATEIRQTRPVIKAQTLEKDSVKIKNSLSLIQGKFTELGFTKNETVEAVLYGWEQVRIDSPLQPHKSINFASFVDYMNNEFISENGRVQFISTPDKAELTVNGKAIGLTKASKWYPVDEQLSVTCKKEGFQIFETTCSVVPGKNECSCNMKPMEQ